MPAFSYTALGPDGRKVNGTLDAANRDHAYRLLDAKRLQPVSLVPGSGGSGASTSSTKSTASAATISSEPLYLTRGQLILFTEEVADMLDAGLQLEQALSVMEKRRETSSLKPVVTHIRQQVREGISFSAALRHSSRSFSELYCNLVGAGEISGSLPQILRQQAHYLHTMDELQSKVVQAMIYPGFIASAGVGLIIVFMTVLVPKLTTLFQKTGQTIPFLTRLLIDASKFLGSYWWMLLGALIFAVVSFIVILQNPAGRLAWDRLKMRLPLFGEVLRAHFFAQFAHTLATLVTNGIPIQKALQLVTKATSNTWLQGVLTIVGETVGEGGLLSRALGRHPFFPPLIVDLVAVGEQTGELGRALGKVAERNDKELNRKILRLTTFIQPVMILLMAVIIGLVIYSILQGIFSAISGLRTH